MIFDQPARRMSHPGRIMCTHLSTIPGPSPRGTRAKARDYIGINGDSKNVVAGFSPRPRLLSCCLALYRHLADLRDVFGIHRFSTPSSRLFG